MVAALGIPVDTAADKAAVDVDWQWLVGQAAMDAVAAGKAGMGATAALSRVGNNENSNNENSNNENSSSKT